MDEMSIRRAARALSEKIALELLERADPAISEQALTWAEEIVSDAPPAGASSEELAGYLEQHCDPAYGFVLARGARRVDPDRRDSFLIASLACWRSCTPRPPSEEPSR